MRVAEVCQHVCFGGSSRTKPSIPDNAPGRFPHHISDRFPNFFLDYAPDSSSIPSCPHQDMVYQEMVCSHPVPSTIWLPTFTSHSHPAGKKREYFSIPSIGKTQKTTRLRRARRSHPVPRGAHAFSERFYFSSG